VPVGTVKFSPKARVKLSAQRIVKLPPLAAVVKKNGSPKGCGIPSLRAKRSNFTGSHELISPGARRISLCPNGQNFTAVT